MKKFKRTIAAGLTVTMMGTMVLTGCGQGSSSDGTSGNDADPSKIRPIQSRPQLDKRIHSRPQQNLQRYPFL